MGGLKLGVVGDRKLARSFQCRARRLGATDEPKGRKGRSSLWCGSGGRLRRSHIPEIRRSGRKRRQVNVKQKLDEEEKKERLRKEKDTRRNEECGRKDVRPREVGSMSCLVALGTSWPWHGITFRPMGHGSICSGVRTPWLRLASINFSSWLDFGFTRPEHSVPSCHANKPF